MKLSFAERQLLRALTLKYNAKNSTEGYVRVFNARPGYPNLNVYRALERAGKLMIDSVSNATTENMLYGMSNINYTLRNQNA